ncbi:Transmembrane carbohydrate transport protein [Plantibacter sp. RU18]
MWVGSPRTVLAVMCAALLVVVIDVTVLHTAIPSLTTALGADSAQVLWIVDVYPLVVAPLLITSGFLGDRFGRRRLLLLGLILFGVASMGAAVAPDAWWLIAARALMGVGAAMIMPSTMSLIRVAFPERAARLRAVAIWSAVSAGGAAAGPLIGGILVETWWWGAVFLVNVPLCAVVAGVAWFTIRESKSESPALWDGASAGLSVVAVLTLAFAVKEAGAGKSIIALTAGVIAVGAGFWFCRRQLRTARQGGRAMLDIRLFRRAEFSGAVVCVMLAMFAVVGLDLMFAQYLQFVLGLSPLDAAVRLMPLALATVAGALCAAQLVGRLGRQRAIGIGLAAAAAALAPLLLLGASEQVWVFSASLGILGFALEIALVSANDVIISAVPADRAGEAAGIEETAYDLGGGLGVAVLGSAFAVLYTVGFPAVPSASTADFNAAKNSIGEFVRLQAPPGTDLAAAAAGAFMYAFHGVAVISILILAGAALSSFLASRPQPVQPAPLHEQ